MKITAAAQKAKIVFLVCVITGCQTVETGGKVVDSSRKEVILSSSSDPRSALPQGSKDSSITKATQRLEESIKSNPRDVKSLTGLAELQLTQSRLDDAEKNCRRALLVDLKNRDAKRILAQIAIRRGQFKLARIFLNSLGGEGSKDSSVLNMLGLLAYNEKDYGDAMRLWKEALDVNSGDISARMNLGIVYLKNKLFQKASTQFERVLKVAPAHQDALLHLAVVDASRGKYEQAISTYRSILAQDQKNQIALFNMSIAQKNSALYDDAIAGLKSFIRVSQGRSANTDSAFALIEEINNMKESSGQKVSDQDLQILADELAKRKPQPGQAKQTAGNVSTAEALGTGGSLDPKTDDPRSAKIKAGANQINKSQESIEAGSADSDIEALERQLKSPAH